MKDRMKPFISYQAEIATSIVGEDAVKDEAEEDEVEN